MSNGSTCTDLAHALCGYLHEIERCRSLCAKHESTTGIHLRGIEEQVYKLYSVEQQTSQHLHQAVERLRSCDDNPNLQRLERQVQNRTKKHGKLLPIVTKSVLWEDRPLLIHAYKFDADPNMKVELITDSTDETGQELPLRRIASVLQCHEYLAPEFIAPPLAPYDRHEVAFTTLSAYLADKMPSDLYATQCFSASSVSAESVSKQDTSQCS